MWLKKDYYISVIMDEFLANNIVNPLHVKSTVMYIILCGSSL